MSLNYKEVADILKIIDASSCEEVVLELEDTRLVVRRGGAAGGGEISAPKVESITPVMEKQVHSSTSTTAADSSVPDNPASDNDGNCLTLRSPMVGTFYGRPAPDEAPFVKEGSKVTAGTPLCLIEVMKLYSTIEARADGVIESILVEEGKLVDFDQPLFIIRNNDP